MDLKPVSSITKLSAHIDYVLRQKTPIPTPVGEKQRFLDAGTTIRISSVIHGIIARVPKSKIEFGITLDMIAERPSPATTAEWHERADSSNRQAAAA